MMSKAKQELNQRLADVGLYEKCYVEAEERTAYLEGKASIPEDVYKEAVPESFGNFYRLKDSGLTADERREYLLLKIHEEASSAAKHAETTKNCMIFFTVLTAISLALVFIVPAL